MLQIAPHLVSRPGKDILEGVDALVKDGIADPEQLTVGGYSYGGYMTNWLITQTTEFKAAVTGAGAVEHAANWGNDDVTYDDAWYLGGGPVAESRARIRVKPRSSKWTKSEHRRTSWPAMRMCGLATWKMFCWSERCSSCRCRTACWFFPARDTRSRKIHGTDISRYEKSCSGLKNTAGKTSQARLNVAQDVRVRVRNLLEKTMGAPGLAFVSDPPRKCRMFSHAHSILASAQRHPGFLGFFNWPAICVEDPSLKAGPGAPSSLPGGSARVVSPGYLFWRTPRTAVLGI